jgi:hypothetical protein
MAHRCLHGTMLCKLYSGIVSTVQSYKIVQNFQLVDRNTLGWVLILRTTVTSGDYGYVFGDLSFLRCPSGLKSSAMPLSRPSWIALFKLMYRLSLVFCTIWSNCLYFIDKIHVSIKIG